jgi:hypothetical protein
MLDVSVVEGYQPEVAYNRRFFVVEQHNFGMPGLVVPGVFEACILGACSLAGGCWHGFVAGEGVAG